MDRARGRCAKSASDSASSAASGASTSTLKILNIRGFDLGNLNFGFVLRLCSFFECSAQRIEKRGVMRQRLQLFKRRPRLVDHEVLEIEMNLVNSFGDFRIRARILFSFRVDRPASDASRDLIFSLAREAGIGVVGINRQRLLPFGGKVVIGESACTSISWIGELGRCRNLEAQAVLRGHAPRSARARLPPCAEPTFHCPGGRRHAMLHADFGEMSRSLS